MFKFFNLQTEVIIATIGLIKKADLPWLYLEKNRKS
jgi:hypothetical protein